MERGRSGESGLRERLPGAVAGLLFVAAVLAAERAGTLERAELAVFDRFVRGFAEKAPAGARSPSPEGAATAGFASAVFVVAIGDADFDRFGHPIPDGLLALALERLAELGADAIGVDLYRPGPAGGGQALAGWSALSAAVARHPQIVLTERLASASDPGLPAPGFVPVEQIGFNDLLVDPDQAVRRGYLYAWDAAETPHVSLALRLASLHLAARDVLVGPDPDRADGVRIGPTSLAPIEPGHGGYAAVDAGGFQIPLDHRLPPERLESVSFGRLLDGQVDRSQVAGRVAIVGTDAPSVKDDFETPTAGSSIVKGFRIHALSTDQLIRSGLGVAAPRAVWSEAAERALAVAFGLAALAIVLGLGSIASVVPALGLLSLLPFGLAAILFVRGTWIPSVEPALACAGAGIAGLALRARTEARARQTLVGLFSRFASARVAEELWRERARFMDGGRPRPRRVVLTALLSDLEGYSTAAEKLEPERLLDWIGEYMDAMTRVIEAHGGHVDDFIGDGIKANFGVPIPSESEQAIARDARAAVDCALAMGRGLEAFNARWEPRGLPRVRQRIGIATGPAVVGAIGSEARMKYTSVGDTINLAARLEAFSGPEASSGLSNGGSSRILISDSTRRRLADGLVLEDLGEQRVKGRAEPVRIHRVLGEGGGEDGA